MKKHQSKIKEVQETLNEFFNKKVKDSILGFDLEDLSIQKLGVNIEDCSKCAELFTVRDCGLRDDNVALFWRFCEKLNSPSAYCAGHDRNSDPKLMGSYRFCYNERVVSSVEEAIEKLDFIRALDRACGKVLKVCAKRIEHHRKVDRDFISKNFEGSSRTLLSKRSSMWHDIREGVRRLLVMPSEKWKNEKQIEGIFSSKNGFLIRALHGHQLKRLRREDRYNVAPQKPDLLTLGHYHLQMVLRKFNTWVLTTGHFLLYPTPRQKGFLSHLGAPILRIGKDNEPHFELRRHNERPKAV